MEGAAVIQVAANRLERILALDIQVPGIPVLDTRVVPREGHTLAVQKVHTIWAKAQALAQTSLMFSETLKELLKIQPIIQA
ncbi:hypothetical protein QLQ09_01235 [Brucella sp. NM4]|uniref:hypothetical protein n=1 Tax=Brucella/Ochrobactrum group TaxID=2826938 RepID=UPI0024BC5610|nr:hypothetical protein [Brucella sp. NM4]WHS30239.1 hypothetical protein QLQ09_01235 [Brucella sp. NM4]WHT44278.1 hypothetical protein QLQ11_20820 [Ochrobactrum sp. SSR]